MNDDEIKQLAPDAGGGYVPKSTAHFAPASEIEMIPKPDSFVPEESFPEGHEWAGASRCTAWSPRKGRQCGRLAMRGATKCPMHGGKAVGGALSPQFIHGKRSKYLPADILAKYTEVSQDPNYLSLRFELNMTDVRIAELFESLGELGESTKWVRDLQKIYNQFSKALKSKNKLDQKAAFERLGRIIDNGAQRRDIWNELARMFETKKRLTTAERDRLESMEAMWTAEQAVTFASALSASFKNTLERYVDDDELRDKILREQAIEARELMSRSEPVKNER